MESYIEHHGILGMKWGVRRFQNPDGSLTEAGKKRYFDSKRDGRLSYKGQAFSQTEAGRRARSFYKEERRNYFNETAARSEVKAVLQKNRKEYASLAKALEEAHAKYYKSVTNDEEYDESTYTEWTRVRTEYKNFVQKVTNDVVSIVGPAPVTNGFTMYEPNDVDEIAFMLDRANDSRRTEDLIYRILYYDPLD